MRKEELDLIIVGLNAFAQNQFTSVSPPIKDMHSLEISNAVFDELHLREKTTEIDTSNVKEDWQLDTIMLAKFLGDLEAGNINNNGLEIAKFAIKRRKVDEHIPMTIGYKPFVNNSEFVYRDYTQGIGDYIYSIVPVGVNEFFGLPNDIIVKSDFAGWFVVDKENNQTLAFDKFIGSENSVNTQLNQGRVQLDTLSRFPKFIYTDQEYHTFSLKGVFIPEEWENSGQLYEDILNQYVRTHKPFLVKGSSGEIYIAEISAPNKTAPQNVYKGYDYMDLTLSFTEIMTETEYNNMFL
jgi:hypothetical protein